jgi:hypothetical protein
MVELVECILCLLAPVFLKIDYHRSGILVLVLCCRRLNPFPVTMIMVNTTKCYINFA